MGHGTTTFALLLRRVLNSQAASRSARPNPLSLRSTVLLLIRGITRYSLRCTQTNERNRMLTETQTVGTHKHKCKCGNIWEHADTMAGDPDAHTCSECGNRVW